MSKATRISTLKMTRRLTAGSPQTPHPQTCYGGSVQKHSAPAPPSRASSSSCHFPCTLCRNNPPSLDCCHRHHPKNVELEWKRKLQRVLCVPMCSNLRWTMHCRWSPTQHGPVFPIPDPLPGSVPCCCVHDRLREKAVAFKGTNTWRRFYASSPHNVSTGGYYFNLVAWWVSQFCSWYISVRCIDYGYVGGLIPSGIYHANITIYFVGQAWE
jgi:hypothetical protein